MGPLVYVFGRRPIFRPKIENFTGTKFYLFSILYTPANFQASRFNNIKKIAKSVDPLKYSVVCTVYFLKLKAENTAVTKADHDCRHNNFQIISNFKKF